MRNKDTEQISVYFYFQVVRIGFLSNAVIILVIVDLFLEFLYHSITNILNSCVFKKNLKNQQHW